MLLPLKRSNLSLALRWLQKAVKNSINFDQKKTCWYISWLTHYVIFFINPLYIYVVAKISWMPKKFQEKLFSRTTELAKTFVHNASEHFAVITSYFSKNTFTVSKIFHTFPLIQFSGKLSCCLILIESGNVFFVYLCSD